MQAPANNRWSIRIAILLVVLSGLVATSWLLASPRASKASLLPEDYLGETLFRAGASTDHRLESLQDKLRKTPDDWRAFSQLGLVFLQKARETGDPTYYQKTEDALSKALAMEPEDYSATGAMGALALSRHQFRDALKWGERARSINPDRAYAYGVKTDALVELGRYDEAVQTLQHMVDMRPDASAYARVSYLRELNGDTNGAIRMMQWAVDSAASPENTAWSRTQLGNLYFNSGDLSRAEQEYQRVLAELPGYVYAQAGLGRLRAAQGQTFEAISLLEHASQSMPLPEFVITLADLYQAAGMQESAHKQQILLGGIQRLYQVNGVDLDLELALYNADHGIDPAGTLAQARQAYARRPSVYAADVLAWALYQAGDYQAALSYSQEALRLGTKDALKLFHAGMIYSKLNNPDQARHFLESALAVNPNFSIVYAPVARQTVDDLMALTAVH